MAVERYNAGIQRAKGLLEIAAALYDTTLTINPPRCGRRPANRFPRRPGLASFTRGKQECAGKPCADLLYYRQFSGNYRRRPGRLLSSLGKPLGAVNDGLSWQGPFKKRLPLRTIAVFPSFDVMGFAVHESTGITSLAQIKQKAQSSGFHRHSAAQRHRGQRDDVYCFGGAPCRRFYTRRHAQMGRQDSSVPHPSDPARRAAIESRSIDAIFDEGIKSWGQTALDNGFRYLPIAGNVLKQMTALGFRRTDMSRCSFHGNKSEVQLSTSAAGR